MTQAAHMHCPANAGTLGTKLPHLQKVGLHAGMDRLFPCMQNCQTLKKADGPQQGGLKQS